MAFNFKQYTSNNPLLQEINDDPTVSNVDAYAETGGLEEDEAKKYPRATLEKAIFDAKSNGVKKVDALYYIDLVYGKDGDADKKRVSDTDFDYMDNDQLDAAGLTGDKIGPDN